MKNNNLENIVEKLSDRIEKNCLDRLMLTTSGLSNSEDIRKIKTELHTIFKNITGDQGTENESALSASIIIRILSANSVNSDMIDGATILSDSLKNSIYSTIENKWKLNADIWRDIEENVESIIHGALDYMQSQLSNNNKKQRPSKIIDSTQNSNNDC